MNRREFVAGTAATVALASVPVVALASPTPAKPYGTLVLRMVDDGMEITGDPEQAFRLYEACLAETGMPWASDAARDNWRQHIHEYMAKQGMLRLLLGCQDLFSILQRLALGGGGCVRLVSIPRKPYGLIVEYVESGLDAHLRSKGHVKVTGEPAEVIKFCKAWQTSLWPTWETDKSDAARQQMAGVEKEANAGRPILLYHEHARSNGIWHKAVWDAIQQTKCYLKTINIPA